MSGSKKEIIIDLTKPLDTHFMPYSQGDYSDPPLEISEWSSVRRDGFQVSRISLGTQSGTHIDAPVHFLEGAGRMETLSSDRFMGRYFLLNLKPRATLADILVSLTAYGEEEILFLRTPENQCAMLPREAVQQILLLPPVLLVISGGIVIEHSDHLEFNRMVAESDKFLVEDLDEKAAWRITGSGELFVFPLRLIGVSGSPCRVLIRMP